MESKKGDFTFQLSDEAPISHVSINEFGDRITSKQHLIDSISKPVIQLYGCSNTFGFSLNDEQTQSYFLQNMLLNYEVQNKGVPAYSLGQMYLHLLKNVNEGRKPNIAILNYSNFHDIRTAEHYD